MFKTCSVLAILFASATPATAAAVPAQSTTRPAAVIHHQVSANAQAQAAFDRGLLDYYAYNPEAAEHEFYTAADLDPHAAMAWWGIALSNAPNINVPPTDDRSTQATQAIAKAKSLEAYATDEDRAFIDAAAAYLNGNPKPGVTASFAAYRDALQRIATANPNDPDAAALYDEMTLYAAIGDAYGRYDFTQAERAALVARVASILPVLTASLEKFPLHAGVEHFYIHAAQMAHQSALAAAAAKQLAAFALPLDASHLTHMPGHTFFDLGMYAEALDVAQRSVAMDDADFACCHPGYYSAPRYYRGHNLTFLMYAMTQTGHAAESVEIARRDGNTTFVARQLVAAGRWQDVTALPYTKGKDATLAFARGIAFAKLGDTAQAQSALSEIPEAPAGASAQRKAAIAALHSTLAAEIAVAAHDDATALRLLTDASAQATTSDIDAETPAMYYYSPHMALAELAVRLGRPDVARAALQAELIASPKSSVALAALAKLGASR